MSWNVASPIWAVSVDYAADGAALLATPETGRVCLLLDISNNPTLYLFIPPTGETRLIDYGETSIGNFTTDTFNLSNPNIVYYAQNGSANPNVFECTYPASSAHCRALAPSYAQSSTVSCNNLTSGTGNDLLSQIGKVVPGFNASYFGLVTTFGPMAGNFVSFTVDAGTQEVLPIPAFSTHHKPLARKLPAAVTHGPFIRSAGVARMATVSCRRAWVGDIFSLCRWQSSQTPA
jgi:hypothetical protein